MKHRCADVGCEVLTAVVMKSAVFWYMTPCSPFMPILKIIRDYHTKFNTIHLLHSNFTVGVTHSCTHLPWSTGFTFEIRPQSRAVRHPCGTSSHSELITERTKLFMSCLQSEVSFPISLWHSRTSAPYWTKYVTEVLTPSERTTANIL
jgi:hypothetical protein